MIKLGDKVFYILDSDIHQGTVSCIKTVKFDLYNVYGERVSTSRKSYSFDGKDERLYKEGIFNSEKEAKAFLKRYLENEIADLQKKL